MHVFCNTFWWSFVSPLRRDKLLENLSFLQRVPSVQFSERPPETEIPSDVRHTPVGLSGNRVNSEAFSTVVFNLLLVSFLSASCPVHETIDLIFVPCFRMRKIWMFVGKTGSGRDHFRIRKMKTNQGQSGEIITQNFHQGYESYQKTTEAVSI